MRRTVHVNASDLSEIYQSWPDCLRSYGCDVIASVWKDEFAKTHAIHVLSQGLQDHPPTAEQGDLLRALLTDRGLLFPQTRERHYDREYSMQLSLAVTPMLQESAYKISSPDESSLDRLLRLGKELYANARDSFYDVHDKSIPFISLENTLTGIKTLVDGREGPFHIQEMSKEYELGYVSPKIGKPENANDPAAVELYAKQWLNHVTFTWGDGETESFLSPQKLQEALGFPTIECYGFIAYILRDCLCRDAQYREWSGAKYIPGLNNSQLKEFADQVSSFKKETFSQWEAALPVLKEYLHPDLKPFEKRKMDPFVSGLDHVSKNAHCSRLKTIFRSYLAEMEPESDLLKSCSKDEDTPESNQDRLLNMAEWFLSFRRGNDPPLFLNRPHLIFALFRSPLHRYISNYENRSWVPYRVIEEACVSQPLPITNQSLKMDTALFSTIVDVCESACKQAGIPFPAEAWMSLWHCIEQCVQCLNFQIGDLSSVKNYFIHPLYLNEEYIPVLDQWIEQRLTSRDPNAIRIWHAFMKKCCNPSSKQIGTWQEAVDRFRDLFEDVETDSDCIKNHLDHLCSKIKWTGITVLPPPEELAAINQNVKPRARKGVADLLRNGIDPQKKDQIHAAFKRLWVEWLLIQCVCEQARRELMEAVYLYLTKAKQGPA